MLKLFITAAILASANAYYNHGLAHQPYYNNYGHAGAPVPIAPASVVPVNPHHANIYNHAYGNLAHSTSHPKIIEATYPGAVHKSSSYAVANPTGYIASEYQHPRIDHPVSASTYVHPPTVLPAGHTTLPYNHPSPVAPSLTYNHASVGNYAHSHYAVTEGPNYAHSRFSINGSPALSYGHARYPIGVGHNVEKIAYNPLSSHMGFQSHAAQSYTW